MTQQSPFEDIDPTETQEWLESIDSVLRAQGPERAHFLLEKLVDFTRRSGAYLPFKPNTAYLNTISRAQEPDYPGDRSLERRNEAYMRWNALAMVVQANRVSSEYGGHIASYASAATLYEVGFNHFWRATQRRSSRRHDFHAGSFELRASTRAPISRGGSTKASCMRFRQEVRGGGLSSYPHPWLMPDFWQFPTVSMGLGPMMAMFQARFVRYLEHRGIVPPSDRKGLGVSRRRRDGRARVDGRAHHAGARETRQPHFRHQLQSAASRRSGARQRQDHPGARGGVSRCRLECHQGACGARAGIPCSSATKRDCSSA